MRELASSALVVCIVFDRLDQVSIELKHHGQRDIMAVVFSDGDSLPVRRGDGT